MVPDLSDRGGYPSGNEDFPDEIDSLRLGRSHGISVGPDALALSLLATRERGPGGRRCDGRESQGGLDGRTD